MKYYDNNKKDQARQGQAWRGIFKKKDFYMEKHELIVVRVKPELKERLKKYAENLERSLSELIRIILKDFLKKN